MSSNQELQMTKQMIIHYRSELSKYKAILADLDTQLEKEKVRNGYLQMKMKDLVEKDIADYKKEIGKLRNKVTYLEVELEEERSLQSIPTEKALETPHIEANGYFNYAVLLPGEDETQLDILGDFYLSNPGTEELQNIILCLKLSPANAATLSGKIANPHIIKEELTNQAIDWVFATDDWKTKIKNSGEFWIRSLSTPHLAAGHTLAFKGFELTLNTDAAQGKLTLDAFIYADNLTQPIPSKNKLTFHLP